MKFKYTIPSFDAVDAAIREFYVEREEEQADGTKKKVIRLDVEGAAPIEKLNEFRENNRTMNGELKKYQALGTVEALAELNTRAEELNAAKLIKADKVEEYKKQVADTLSAKHKTEIDKVIAERDKANKQIADLLITTESQRVASAHSFNPKALPTLQLLANKVWRMEDGKPVAYDDAGNPILAEDGFSKISMEGWVKKLSVDMPFLFLQSNGGGAQGSAANGGANGHAQLKHFLPGPDFNRSIQVKIMNTDRPLYDQLVQQAAAHTTKK